MIFFIEMFVLGMLRYFDVCPCILCHFCHAKYLCNVFRLCIKIFLKGKKETFRIPYFLFYNINIKSLITLKYLSLFFCI